MEEDRYLGFNYVYDINDAVWFVPIIWVFNPDCDHYVVKEVIEGYDTNCKDEIVNSIGPKLCREYNLTPWFCENAPIRRIRPGTSFEEVYRMAEGHCFEEAPKEVMCLMQEAGFNIPYEDIVELCWHSRQITKALHELDKKKSDLNEEIAKKDPNFKPKICDNCDSLLFTRGNYQYNKDGNMNKKLCDNCHDIEFFGISRSEPSITLTEPTVLYPQT